MAEEIWHSNCVLNHSLQKLQSVTMNVCTAVGYNADVCVCACITQQLVIVQATLVPHVGYWQDPSGSMSVHCQ